MSDELRVTDDDERPRQMTERPSAYFSAARARAERYVAAETRKPATLAPGIVAMSLRGGTQDVERVIAAIRAAGGKVFRANSRGTRSGNQAGYQYFSVEIPKVVDGS